MSIFLSFVFGAFIGIGITLLAKHVRKTALIVSQDAETQPPREEVPFGTKDDAETIQFLYDKRLTLFNTRREHEWKTFFGAMIMLGAIDAVLLTHPLVLTRLLCSVWSLTCVMFFIFVLGYERDLQKRNARDRAAMDQLFDRLCDLVGIEEESTIRAIPQRVSGRDAFARRSRWRPTWWSNTGLYAFRWQMLLLCLVVLISMLLPWLKLTERPCDCLFV